MNVNQLRFRCAGATTACTGCRACECLGKENCRVFGLPDVVRERCVNLKRLPGFHNECTECFEGWTPATDGWVWWRAIKDIGWYVDLSRLVHDDESMSSFDCEIGPLRRESLGNNDDPELAFFTALHQALESMGATFPEESDYVV